jgi:hypothetical protein
MVMSETTARARVAPAEEMVSPAESPRPLALGGSRLKRASRYAPARAKKTASTAMKVVSATSARYRYMKASTVGAVPRLTMSTSESSCKPKADPALK